MGLMHTLGIWFTLYGARRDPNPPLLLAAPAPPPKWRSRRGRDKWRPPPVTFRRQPRMPGIFNSSRIAAGLPGSDVPEVQTGNEIPNLRDGWMSWNDLHARSREVESGVDWSVCFGQRGTPV
jgi:hypothetical protein